MAVHHRLTVIVIAVYRSNGPAARLVQIAQISFQHRQMVQCKGLHSIQLYPVCNSSVFCFLRKVKHTVDLLLCGPSAVKGSVIRFGDKLLRAKGFAIDSAAVRNALLCIDGINDILRHIHVRVEAPAGLKLSRICQNKVTGSKFGNVFVHVKAAGKGDRQGQQNHRQSQ